MPGVERLDVVRHLALEELGHLGACEQELAALRAVHEADGLTQALVFGCGDHGIDSTKAFYKLPGVALAEDFQAVLDTLPPDWTDLALDLRIFDEERYIEAATILVQINAAPYSKHDWHWRLNVAHDFGHAAAPETVHGTLSLLDDQGIEGELLMRSSRSGRVEVMQMWGRPESVRREFARRRHQ